MILEPVIRHIRNASSDWMQLDADADQVFYSSVVIEHIVPKGKGYAFKQWYAELLSATKQFEGFVRADRCRPLECKNGVLKWYSIIHFDTPEHLNDWLASAEREALIERGQQIFESYKFKSLTTGLEGWFSREAGSELASLGPPSWKQILSIVLGLYPIVMLQSLVFDQLGVMHSWSPASAMFVNNLITTCILTWLIMPLVIHSLNFWLQPAHRTSSLSLRMELWGTAIVAGMMGLMVIAFDQLHLIVGELRG
jgi:antibiotic biosynthesis monooxygenase (ABM) superfamily enzyme